MSQGGVQRSGTAWNSSAARRARIGDRSRGGGRFVRLQRGGDLDAAADAARRQDQRILAQLGTGPAAIASAMHRRR